MLFKKENQARTIDFVSLKREKTDFEQKEILSAEEAEQYIRQFYHDDISIYESFFLLLLNRAKKTIGYVKVSQGGTAGTVADLKIICKYCLDCLASGVIIAHNHPSGNLKPSDPDIEITERVKKALKVFDVELYDHIILSTEKFFSFANNGIIY
jgi:DNA repair protein RadC